VHQKGSVATVIEDHVRALVAELEDAVGVVPVLRRDFRPCRRRRACHPRRFAAAGVGPGGENVAGSPAHLGAEGLKSLDEDRGLDASCGGSRRFRGRPSAAAGRRTLPGSPSGRHLRLGDAISLRPQGARAEVGDMEVRSGWHGCVHCRRSPLSVWRAAKGNGRRIWMDASAVGSLSLVPEDCNAPQSLNSTTERPPECCFGKQRDYAASG